MEGICTLTLVQDASSVPPVEFVRYLPAEQEVQDNAPRGDHWPEAHCCALI